MKSKIFKLFLNIPFIYLFSLNPGLSSEEIQIIEKINNKCPMGFYATGGFCKSYKNNKRKAILNINNLQCPSGFFQSAKYYCLSHEKIN